MAPKSSTLIATGKFTSQLKQVATTRKITPEMAKVANKERNKGKTKEVKSVAKQAKVNREDGVQVKEVPAVVGEEVKKAGKFVGKEAKKVGKFFKKLAKKVGNTTLTKTKKQKIKKKEEQLKKLKSKK